MRVALVIYGSIDSVSGGYLYDRKLVDQLRARGHEVAIISRPWRTYLRHLTDNFSREWRQKIQQIDADLLLEDELNHPSLVLAPRPVRADGAPIPIVTIVHHLRSSEQHPALRQPFYRAVERHYLRRANAFIFNSQTTRAAVEALRPTLPRHIVAYPAGDHVPAIGSSSLHEVSPLGEAPPPDAPLNVLFVGNVIPRKELHTVIAAIALADAPVHLAVVGNLAADPQYVERLYAQVAEANLSDRVHFLGTLADDQLAVHYANCDLLAVPSYEGFGIVYLEAMAFGHPVIASTAGAAHEIVNAGENGFLVAPGDASALARYLTALARDPSLREEMSAAARARFAEFPTWEQSTTAAAEFLESIAE